MSEFNALGPLEKEILTIVWQNPQVSVKIVHRQLLQCRKIAYTTVMTILCRLVEKGLLDREKKGKTFFYTAKVNREQTLRALVKNTIAHIVDRFGEDAIAAFIDEAEQLHNCGQSTPPGSPATKKS